jgi:NAD(P)-dependent dehydrogenase (short-subunit alcohol dehydrogenase family)
LDETAAELESIRVAGAQRNSCHAADVAVAAQLDAVFDDIGQAHGGLDILVCCAGVYGPKGSLEDVDWQDWMHAVEINLFGTVLACRAALRWMRRRRGGKIVLLSGGGATAPMPRLSAYAASKAAVVRFAETLAEEVRDSQIEVNAVAPGGLNTRLLDEILAAGPDAVGPDFYRRAVQQKRDGGVPLATGAELVLFLASAESNGISGRLLSAVWDDWQALPHRREKLAKSDVFTLRRIVPADRGWDQP